MPQYPRNNAVRYPGTRILRSGRIFERVNTRRSVWRDDFGVNARCAAPLVLPESGFRLALGSELTIQPLSHCIGIVVGTQTQNPTPRVLDHATRFEHDFLHHRLHAPSLGRMVQWRVLANQRLLANEAQDVHRNSRQGTNQKMGAKLATGQTLQIHI